MSEPLIHISRQQALCFAAVLVFYEFLTYIANDMIMPGMLQVVRHFHADESNVASSLTAYVLGGASLQIFLGPLSDRFGRRPVMLAGSGLFFLFTLYIAFSDSMSEFLIARFFEGMGLCFIHVIGYAVLQEIFAEMDAVRLISVLAMVSILAPLLGPLAGAFFILYFDWRAIFFMIGILALFAFLGFLRYMPESVGALKKDGSRIPREALAFKVIFKNYARLLQNPGFMIGSIAAGLLAVPCIIWIALSPIMIITDAKLSVIDYALWQLPLFGASIIGNIALRKFTRLYSLKKIIGIGAVFTALGLLLCYLLPLLISPYFIWLIPGLSIYGFGIGVCYGPLNRYILFSTSVAKGTASAMLMMICMSIQALGVEIGKEVYALHNNVYFGLYCVVAGLLFCAGLLGMKRLGPSNDRNNM